MSEESRGGGRRGGETTFMETMIFTALMVKLMIIFWPVTLGLFLGALFSIGVQGADKLTTAGYAIAFLVAAPIYAYRWHRRRRA